MKTFSVAILSAIVSAFVAGVTVWILLDQDINERIESVVPELIDKGKIKIPPGQPGAPGQLAVIADGGGLQPSGNTTFAQTLDLSQRAVLLVTAYSELSAEGFLDNGAPVPGNAAASIAIKIDKTIVTENEEVHFSATRPGLLISATSATLLEPGKHELEITVVDVGGSTIKISPKVFQVKYCALGTAAAPASH